ncbi:restriction endonuclease subunit S [Crocinitomix algicola]|uniref:restriction endonuclease subunit S n=1 Tax=Crocinitomix algicola TaxID=1740263 RepID=UPI0008727703|nr:restriction endonuclease subunit S [Crocinitomix algicola]
MSFLRRKFIDKKIPILPNGWKIVELPKAAFFQEGPGLRNWQFTKKGIKVINVTNLVNGYLDLDKTDRHISLEEFNEKYTHFEVDEGDIVMASSGATYCKVAVVRDIDLPLMMNTSVIRYKPLNGVDYNYLKSYLESSFFKTQIDFLITGGAQPNFGPVHIKQSLIVLPTEPEQKAISNIISTWDAAITDTQNLIQQLKLRKKGLMQQLLTGKKRLSGFDGEWEIARGNELFKNHSNKNHDGELEVLSATQDQGVIPRSETGIDIKYDPKSLKNYKKVEIGDFVISLRSFQGGIEYSRYEGIVSPAYTVLKESKPIAKDFYREYLKTTDFINKLNSIIYGIRDGKQISYKEFGTLKIHYPPIDEQNAIAKVIATADEEIKSFVKKLESLENQKKGLMQQLLTGQKRVI